MRRRPAVLCCAAVCVRLGCSRARVATLSLSRGRAFIRVGWPYFYLLSALFCEQTCGVPKIITASGTKIMLVSSARTGTRAF